MKNRAFKFTRNSKVLLGLMILIVLLTCALIFTAIKAIKLSEQSKNESLGNRLTENKQNKNDSLDSSPPQIEETPQPAPENQISTSDTRKPSVNCVQLERDLYDLVVRSEQYDYATYESIRNNAASYTGNDPSIARGVDDSYNDYQSNLQIFFNASYAQELLKVGCSPVRTSLTARPR